MGKMLVALSMQAAVIAGLLTVALDIKAHSRVERLGGVNMWGYRGPVMRRKAPNEVRIAGVGGDLAFGWGVAASETLIANVRQLVSIAIDKRGHLLRPVTALNLGATGLHPDEYAAWIEHFAYLRPDILCIVVDPRSHSTKGVSLLPDRASPLFTAFGYAPILPL